MFFLSCGCNRSLRHAPRVCQVSWWRCPQGLVESPRRRHTARRGVVRVVAGGAHVSAVGARVCAVDVGLCAIERGVGGFWGRNYHLLVSFG
nr:MAG TPA: hypothetical protein [Caudoviricetes sp.]